jgi:hypothetical protein
MTPGVSDCGSALRINSPSLHLILTANRALKLHEAFGKPSLELESSLGLGSIPFVGRAAARALNRPS